MVDKLVNLRDRAIKLQVACSRGEWKVENVTVYIYLDYNTLVQRQREAFRGVKQHLSTLDLRYALFFLAKLCIMDREEAHFFTDAGGIWGGWKGATTTWTGFQRPQDGRNVGTVASRDAHIQRNKKLGKNGSLPTDGKLWRKR
ncbi:hypothetical protein NDU88_010460 [Pleurodeles waltl]|uniref:Uncharacterized protein n=1 Tax=Pleurodeles waltl TaxID=8319 RepID=A0AAV7QVS5_PLEWA|nr:hypothetical protein NDU88_010460 [Pleurodeles waltl]